MLVLTQKRGQSILIGCGQHEIRMTVVRIDRGRVRVGITAPADTTILRSELERRPAKSTNLE